MADIIVTGYNAKARKIVISATEYYLAELFSDRKRLCNNLEIQIKLLPKALHKEDHTRAWNWCEDTNLRPRSFIVEASYKDKYKRYIRFGQVLQSIAHECIHIKQWATEEMQERYKPEHHVLWYGEPLADNTDQGYWDSPAEMECYAKERGLYWMYCKKNKYDKESWYDELTSIKFKI